jgi:hypothetical protein
MTVNSPFRLKDLVEIQSLAQNGTKNGYGFPALACRSGRWFSLLLAMCILLFRCGAAGVLT